MTGSIQLLFTDTFFDMVRKRIQDKYPGKIVDDETIQDSLEAVCNGPALIEMLILHIGSTQTTPSSSG